jgi:transposase-like protein
MMVAVMTSEPSKRTHWTAQRKRELLADIDRGKITIEQACRLYNMSLDELAAWREGRSLFVTKGQPVRARRR